MTLIYAQAELNKLERAAAHGGPGVRYSTYERIEQLRSYISDHSKVATAVAKPKDTYTFANIVNLSVMNLIR